MKKTLDAFVAASRFVHGDTYSYELISEFPNMSSPCPILCKTHGVFRQLPFNHQRGQGCPECSKARGISKRKDTLEEWIEKARAKHGDYYNYDLITEPFCSNTKVPIVCPKHGGFLQRATNHISFGTGCPKCNCGGGNALGKEEIIRRAIAKHGSTYDYSLADPVHTLKDMTVICRTHGPFDIQVAKHLRGGRCPHCMSVIGGSAKQNAWLDFVGVPNTAEHREIVLRLDDGIGDGYLRVDGIDRETNTVYEFWGDHWHGNPEIYQPLDRNRKNGKTMGELYEATLAKRSRILNAGYALVEIWENEWDRRTNT